MTRSLTCLALIIAAAFPGLLRATSPHPHVPLPVGSHPALQGDGFGPVASGATSSPSLLPRSSFSVPGSSHAPGTGPTAVDGVRARLDAYLEAYESELASLVATETLEQKTSHRFARPKQIKAEKRTLVSEVAFVALPETPGLLGFRRVAQVNGVALKDEGPSVQELLQQLPGGRVSRELLEQGARHNLGLPRSTNFPSLPVELLHPRHRARFAHWLDRPERIRGTPVSVLIANEVATPTLLRSDRGEPFPSRVTAWVDAEGRLLRAEVRLLHGDAHLAGYTPSVRVDFTRHPGLEMLVPTSMHEQFFVEHLLSGTGVAAYTNFRRFQTAARLLP